MKGLTSLVWIGCLCLGLVLTPSSSEVAQNSVSWSSKTKLDSTLSYSITVLEFIHRHYGTSQRHVLRLATHSQNDKIDHYLTVNRADHLTTPEEKVVSKRSVKRGEVNYFRNRPDPMINSHRLHLSVKERALPLCLHAGRRKCMKLNRMACKCRKVVFPNRKGRHKRMAGDGTRNLAERKQIIQDEADRRRKESALRRRKARHEKNKRIKDRRLKLKNSGRKNREEIRDNASKRVRSGSRKKARNNLHIRGHKTKAIRSETSARLRGKYSEKNSRREYWNRRDEMGYSDRVLGFSVGNRKSSYAKTQAWSRRVFKRPLAGGYQASFGRLTQARSNLFGASASALSF